MLYLLVYEHCFLESIAFFIDFNVKYFQMYFIVLIIYYVDYIYIICNLLYVSIHVCMFVCIWINKIKECTHNCTIYAVQRNGTTTSAAAAAITSAALVFVFVKMTFFPFRLFPITYKVDILLMIVVVIIVINIVVVDVVVVVLAMIVVVILIVISLVLWRQYGTITTNFFGYINQRRTNIKIFIDKCGILLRSHFVVSTLKKKQQQLRLKPIHIHHKNY